MQREPATHSQKSRAQALLTSFRRPDRFKSGHGHLLRFHGSFMAFGPSFRYGSVSTLNPKPSFRYGSVSGPPGMNKTCSAQRHPPPAPHHLRAVEESSEILAAFFVNLYFGFRGLGHFGGSGFMGLGASFFGSSMQFAILPVEHLHLCTVRHGKFYLSPELEVSTFHSVERKVFGSQDSGPNPRGTITQRVRRTSTILGLGPQNHNKDDLLRPNSIKC